MPATYPEAVEQMQELFYAAWIANAGAVFGYLPGVEWYGKPDADKIDRSKAWARFSTQNVTEEQTSLSTCVDVPYSRRYTGSGLVFLQIFIPKSIDNGVIKGRTLADIGKKAFRGKTTSGGLTFHNARVVDLSPEELFYRFNVVVEYQFDDIG